MFAGSLMLQSMARRAQILLGIAAVTAAVTAWIIFEALRQSSVTTSRRSDSEQTPPATLQVGTPSIPTPQDETQGELLITRELSTYSPKELQDYLSKVSGIVSAAMNKERVAIDTFLSSRPDLRGKYDEALRRNRHESSSP